MNKFKYFLVLLVGVIAVGLSVPVVTALEQPEFGGRSEDYHPPTRNPQGSTPTGLQPTSPNAIQPAPTSINPQALTQSGGLKVLTSSDGGAVTTAPEVRPPAKSARPRNAGIIAGILTFIIVVYIIVKSGNKQETPAETPAPEPSQAAEKPKKTNKPAKKKSGKKSKSVRR